MDDAKIYTLKEASQEIGVPVAAIRRYCKSGLIPHVRRARNGYRVLNLEQLEIAKTIHNLYRIGMTRSDVRQYSALCRMGKRTIPERKAMLETKRRQLWQSLYELQEGIDFVERRQELFDQILGGQNVENADDWL